jgi:two-component system sensor histidine kinase KdpD
MDAILRRSPGVAVVDPLAHKNPAGFPNSQRWQDVEELLSHGISVLTAINLLHVDELRERVERLTGKHAKETVPRDFLARADEFVVVDVPTDLARERREEGAKHLSDESERALSELREMALILAAEVVEGQLEHYLQAQGIAPAWGSHERILVCLTPRSNGPAMIASGKRNRERFHGELHVVHVRQPRLSPTDRARINGFLHLAREADAEVQVLEGDDPVETILEYARTKKITQIFVGHSRRREWTSRLWAGPLDRLLRGADHIDVRIFPQ